MFHLDCWRGQKTEPEGNALKASVSEHSKPFGCDHERRVATEKLKSCKWESILGELGSVLETLWVRNFFVKPPFSYIKKGAKMIRHLILPLEVLEAHSFGSNSRQTQNILEGLLCIPYLAWECFKVSPRKCCRIWLQRKMSCHYEPDLDELCVRLTEKLFFLQSHNCGRQTVYKCHRSTKSWVRWLFVH